MDHPLAERVRKAPDSPGCYLWKDASGRVIYVGKAKQLRRRIASYLQRTEDHPVRTLRMVMEATELEWLETDSEVEALLLENRLIKELQPTYNVRLKDGKEYPMIAISREPFPRVYITRDPKEDADLIGPFISSVELTRAFHFLQRTFRFRTCDLDIQPDAAWRRTFAPCLNWHIKRCSAPCTPKIQAEAYQGDIRSLRAFLGGRGKGPVIEELTTRMRDAAKDLRFEDAARVRDQLQAIDRLKQKGRLVDWRDGGAPVQDIQAGTKALQQALGLATMPRVIEGFDIAHLQGQFVVASCVRFVGGVPDKDGYRRLKIRGEDGDPGNDDFAAMREAVGRRYRRLKDEGRELPDVVLIDGGHGQLAKAGEALREVGLVLNVISLAKAEETVCLSDGRELRLSRRDPGLKLLQHVRDEAHRFCRRYFHLLQRQEVRHKRTHESTQ